MAGRFDDRLTHPLHPYRDVVQMLLGRGYDGPRARRRDRRQIPRVAPHPLQEAGDDWTLTWAGHASYIVQAAGKTLLTDPVWSRSLPGRFRRLHPPGVPWDGLPRIDAVLVSHNHYDHLDAGTVRRLHVATPVFVPLGLGAWFRRRGFRDVTELDWWEAAPLGDLAVHLVPAHHWSRRGVVDANESLWGGFVVEDEAQRRRVHFAGDSAYGAFYQEIGRRFDGFDATMMPIGAYEPRWFMRTMHMDPVEAVQATRDLGARRLAAMHWGTFLLTPEPVLEPLHRVRVAWEAAGLDRDDLWDLAIGETRIVPP